MVTAALAAVLMVAGCYSPYSRGGYRDGYHYHRGGYSYSDRDYRRDQYRDYRDNRYRDGRYR
jgi:hypothetical protein